MAPQSVAQHLVSATRGAVSSQLRERALSALCASTSGSPTSGSQSHCNAALVQSGECVDQALPTRQPFTKSCAIQVTPPTRAWATDRTVHLSASADAAPLLAKFQLSNRNTQFASYTTTNSISHTTTNSISSRAFATAAVKGARSGESEQSAEEILNAYRSNRGADGEEEALRKSMAAIKQNLSVPEAAELGPDVVNKFYTFSEEDKGTRLAEGFPRSLEKEFAQQKDQRILVRQQSLDLFEQVKQRVENRKPSEYRALVLEGPTGGGKSALLTLLVHQCRAAGWLALYVPSGTSWISGGFYEKDGASGFFDTPVQAETALKALLAAHGDLLEQLPLRVPLSAIGPVFGGTANVDLDTEELATGKAEEGNLKSLIETGLENEGERAGEMLARLRVELTRVTEVPVLIAIDEYNSWFGTSAYGEVDEEATKSRRIAATEMRLVHAFGHLDGALGLRNGVVVAAASASLGLPADVKSMPGVYKEVRKTVTRFDRAEAAAILTNYFACGVMINTSKRPSDETISTAHFVTGGNGSQLGFYGPMLQADRPALPSPEASQPLLEGGAYYGEERQPAPRIRNFVQSLSGEF